MEEVLKVVLVVPEAASVVLAVLEEAQAEVVVPLEGSKMSNLMSFLAKDKLS